jgi:protein-disulfide isomerase
MAIYRMLVGLVLGLSVTAFADQAGPDQRGSAVVAEINGHQLTQADLEQKQAGKLLQARYDFYQTQRAALEQLIDGQLLEMQAQREGLSVEQLIQRDIISHVKDLTEDQIQVFHEGMKTNEPLEATREKIVATIRQIRLTKARDAYLQSLREQATVRIALTPPKTVVAVDEAPRRGPQDASVLIVEFADYECPYCQRSVADLKKIQAEFPGKVTLAFKDFPLPMHRSAQKAAEAAGCAGRQGKFWDFHDTMFANAQKLEPLHLKEYARTLKLDVASFDQCLDAGEQAEAVRKDLAQAQRLGLTGTPSFFINGHFLSGAVQYSTLREIVEQQLATPQPSLLAKKGTSNYRQ